MPRPVGGATRGSWNVISGSAMRYVERPVRKASGSLDTSPQSSGTVSGWLMLVDGRSRYPAIPPRVLWPSAIAF